MAVLARYPGTCKRCSGPIVQGQHWITWPRTSGHKGYVHVDCTKPEDKGVTPTTEDRPEGNNGEATLNAEALNALAQALGDRIQTKGVDEKEVRRIVRETVEELVPVPVVIQDPTGNVRSVDIAHQQFAKLVYLVGKGRHVYLYGPPGSGKSHGAMQAAEATGRHYGYISLNPQTPDSRLLGFIHAGGSYVPTVFRHAYEGKHSPACPENCPLEGWVFCIDELDNAAPSLLCTLNSMIENGLAAFPDTMVRRGRFTLVGTGNTSGRGASPQFPERRPFDSAFADRFSYLAWGYDQTLETRLALSINPKCQAWIDWTKALRFWAAENMPKLLVSPRATFKLAEDTLGECPIGLDELVDSVVFHGIDEDAKTKALRAVPLPKGRD